MSLILKLTHPTDNGKMDGDFFSYKAEHLDKTMSEIIAEIDLTPKTGETVEIVAAKLAMFQGFVASKMVQANPDYDAELAKSDPDYDVPAETPYDCTFRELAIALNGNLGAEHVLSSVAVADEAAADKYYAMMFSRAEDYKKDFVDAGLPFKSEREMLHFTGRGKIKPDCTLHASNGPQGMGAWLRQVKNDI